MYIKKQRLLTPGPTPLYPPALHAMMASDIHHRTEDFRKAYRSCLADLKEVMGTSHDVLMFASSGTGAMDATVSNLFSKGDKVIVCVAGKFGERWAEIAKAYGLDAQVLTVPYGQVVTPAQVEAALAAEPATKGVFVQASETSTGAAHDVRGMAAAISKTSAIFVVDAITGLGTMPLDIDGWGLDVVIGGSQKAFMIPPGLAFLSISPKAWKLGETSTLPHFYFNFKKEKKSGDAGESSWTPSTALILALAEALRYVKQIGMAHLVENAQLLAAATRAAVEKLGLELFSAGSPGSLPARLAASRLPGKPLADIAGKPMIAHVLARAQAAGVGEVVVATDSEAVCVAAEKAGGRAVMTSADHPSGSDRIFEALAHLDPERRIRVVVNVQGDLPTLDPADLRAAAALLDDPAVDIATLAAEIRDPAERTNPNIVKMVGTPVGARRMRALYFSRATAPYGEGPLYHHIGLYAYRREALERFVKLPPSTLEKRERLEQLRALEAGMRIDVALVDSVPLGVDTPEELAKARALLSH